MGVPDAHDAIDDDGIAPMALHLLNTQTRSAGSRASIAAAARRQTQNRWRQHRTFRPLFEATDPNALADADEAPARGVLW